MATARATTRLIAVPDRQRSLRIAPDLAHASGLFEVDGGVQLVVNADQVGPFFSRVGGTAIAAGGRWAITGKTAAGWTAFVNGVAGPTFDQVGPPLLGADGRVAYVGVLGVKQHLVRDQVVHAEAFDEVRIAAWRDEGPLHIAWMGRRGDAWYVAGQGGLDLGHSWSKVGAAAVSASGTIAWAVRDASGWWVLVGERRFGPYENVGPPMLSPDGTRAAWGARVGEGWSVFVDGVSQGEYPELGPGLNWCAQGQLVWSAKSQDGSLRVYRDGEPVGEPWMMLSDSPIVAAGDAVAFVATRQQGLWTVVVNDRELATSGVVVGVQSRPSPRLQG